MLLDEGERRAWPEPAKQRDDCKRIVLAGGIIYAAGNSSLALGTIDAGVNLDNPASLGSAVRLGQLLYSPFTYSYVLPFEIASIVLLVAIVGAIIIAREE